MVETGKTQQMPRAMKIAEFIVSLQAVQALAGGALLAFVLVNSAGDANFGLVLLFVGFCIVIAVLAGWLLSRWIYRERRYRIAALALEPLLALGFVFVLSLDSDLGMSSLLNLNVILPIIVVGLLLLPSGRAWFNR
ncbi:hypothetical protein SAMN05216276_10926 [Streptosporangium subroseum]|uniref:Uncharacterized protein n=1 Tax=Streptosporangium subroseum TaxID=106412 RepID=A0A239P639_9ACTN|nr:hypothetical protein [Streptosporangium subroseum]SNT62556.1 hypothetical protein SAMN05216276_10926 [Streptosporangium subroseum]